jgi:hypothetical protein
VNIIAHGKSVTEMISNSISSIIPANKARENCATTVVVKWNESIWVCVNVFQEWWKKNCNDDKGEYPPA